MDAMYPLQFASNAFLGNIGAPLRDADEEWNDIMEDADQDDHRVENSSGNATEGQEAA